MYLYNKIKYIIDSFFLVILYLIIKWDRKQQYYNTVYDIDTSKTNNSALFRYNIL